MNLVPGPHVLVPPQAKLQLVLGDSSGRRWRQVCAGEEPVAEARQAGSAIRLVWAHDHGESVAGVGRSA